MAYNERVREYITRDRNMIANDLIRLQKEYGDQKSHYDQAINQKRAELIEIEAALKKFGVKKE